MAQQQQMTPCRDTDGVAKQAREGKGLAVTDLVNAAVLGKCATYP